MELFRFLMTGELELNLTRSIVQAGSFSMLYSTPSDRKPNPQNLKARNL